ncbi:hypothetical protein CONPUDRAFT_167580 [Coniophora puteana RWD-64-598 SS2]|uniref:F-box domain-containing protein n=1 Tax=Coniophora puteana (strain RWD-64-598) TaxID=741705 RepID=A0A5M3MI45_CONPW|nr:uncharacterized protein CONPUDRAFT_167580 [Coniophora puteana RWD-64-598 SS2]EIW78600.1 hypothetical protein CONPUDRAFT_167580 [Coniophora puteana RWD-64-598 SS2]
MHHVLTNLEVLHKIFSSLQDEKGKEFGEHTITRRSTLARLARTCRTFQEPALDTLWEHLTSADPLLKLLPEKSISYRPWLLANEHRNKGAEAFLQGAGRVLVRADWDLFKTYARRVRILGPFKSYTGVFFYNLELAPHDMLPLLPNLKILDWRGFNDHSIPLQYLGLFLSPTLKRLRIELSTSTKHEELYALSIAPVSCPKIRDLGFSGYEFIRDFGASRSTYYSSQILCQWSNLSNAVFDSVTDDALVHLAQMQTLVSLKVDLDKIDSLDGVRSRVTGTAFPSLTSCSLRCVDVYLSIEFVTIMQLSPVELTLNSPVLDESSPIEELFTTLSTHPSRRELEKVNIHWTKVQFNLPELKAPRDPPEECLTIMRLRPLFSFRQLRVLSINMPLEITLDDLDIIELAHAFPALEELSLNGGDNLTVDPLGPWYVQALDDFSRQRFCAGWLVKPRVTFRGLYALVESCPRLRGLGISFDAEQAADEVPNEVPSPNRDIQYLPVGNSACGDPEGVASRLRSIFPNVSRIMTRWSPWQRQLDNSRKQQKATSDRWEEVGRLLKEPREAGKAP